jgi:integrase
VTTLRFEDLQLREGHWVIADLRGKGGHIRTIPVPEWVKEAVDKWALRAGINAGPEAAQAKSCVSAWGRRSHRPSCYPESL